MSINITKGPWVLDKSGDIVVLRNGPFNKAVLFSNKDFEGLSCPNDDDIRVILNVPQMVSFLKKIASTNCTGRNIGYEARLILNEIKETEL